MKTSLSAIFPAWLLSTLVAASTPLQYCALNEVWKTDICFAVASSKNSSTQANDLSLHISAKFVVDATGWAAVGIGGRMDNALMFVMYPGGENGRITVSTRTTKYHNPPSIAEAAPETHVTRTWIDEDGLHNAQIMCYGCESWTGTKIDVMSASQPWIWATNWKQQTHSDDIHMKLLPHSDRGVAELNMASAFSTTGDVTALVSKQRISQEPGPNDPGPAPSSTHADDSDQHPVKEHHKHSLFGLVSLHGFLLSFGFFALTFGVLGIRSGLTTSYKLHWITQTVGGSAIVIGCLMGILISIKHNSKFQTWHQWIGLAILPSMVIQGLLGYLHHVNYLKYGRRTAVSYYHLWIGRIALLAGNMNVGFGLNLGHAESFKWFTWYASIIIQLSVLLPMWFFYARGKTILDAVRGKDKYAGEVRYDTVEQDAFIVDDELDDLEEEEHDRKSTSKDA